jgi:AmmeMemoRadiSam system protein A
VPSPSPEPSLPFFDRRERNVLVAVAREAVRQGLEGDRRPLVLDSLSPRLRHPGATFVTLRRDRDLLGCIGTLEPVRSVAADVHHNAAAAAFADPRLPSVTRSDFESLSVKVSVLGPLVPLDVRSSTELASTVLPGLGVLVQDGRRRATFLPSVWEQIPDIDRFLTMLWQKAGLAPGRWTDQLRVSCYQTVEFGDSGG